MTIGRWLLTTAYRITYTQPHARSPHGMGASRELWASPSARRSDAPPNSVALTGNPTGATPGAPLGSDPPYAQHMRAQVDSLYQQHARAVLGYLCQRLPHQADAEDALAEVFCAALQTCARGQSIDLPWLLTVARRRAADFYRARQRHGGSPIEHGL
ncbi:MAG: sigma-70 family RNA polymerase sigma factor, partial [Ktedonobacterales bacterium]